MQSRRIAQVALLTFLFAAGVRADGARFWTVESGKDLNEGKPEKITLTADEALILAPRIKRLVDTGQPFIWCLGLDRRTGCLYAATGHEGRVLRIGADGDTATVFDAGQAEVSALALNEKGDLFVGTSPEGAVYRLAGGQGPARLFYDPEEKYIWSLVFDSGGKLHVAVGPKGKVYRLDSGGKARLILDSDETHIISLAFDRQGNLLAGSSGEALVVE
ncbi:MAG: hypothetical protein U9P14_09385, partial [Gemmatimonadota bacterium]|nr:hypothetical protein [Gemmatimonadota bacterium]